MADLRIPVLLNKGSKGIPFDKLARISYEFQQFLSLLSEDLRIERGAGWLATGFYDGSFGCTAEKIDPVEEPKAKAFKQALDWITYYAPEMVVLEEIPADTRKGAYTQSLLLAIESAANNVNVEHVRIARPASGPNKYADAAELAAEFPQIASWLPHPRRLWETEPRNVIYFEALALVWAWWKSSGRGSSEEDADA